MPLRRLRSTERHRSPPPFGVRPVARQARRPVYTPRAPARNVPPSRHPPYAASPSRQQPAGQRRGLFRDMAATAGGVAVGTAVGSAVGHAITGGGGRHQSQQQPAAAPAPAPVAPAGSASAGVTHPQEEPCQFEVIQFLSCAQNETDLNMCVTFNDALRDCLAANNLGV